MPYRGRAPAVLRCTSFYSDTNSTIPTSCFGDSSQVGLLDSSDGHGSGFDKVLEAEIVNTSGGENDVGARVDDELNAFLGDVIFPLTDGLQLVRIFD